MFTAASVVRDLELHIIIIIIILNAFKIILTLAYRHFIILIICFHNFMIL
jgi:hypothetical protein